MCVAIFKPAGAETPSLDILKDCWKKNPDGAGLAISERQSVFFRKGFMKFSELEDFYYSNNLIGRVGQAMVFHFRIGTHGVKDAGNTHPFCISGDPVLLRTLTGRVASVVAHNGVFRCDPKHPKISDTGQFIVDCVEQSGGDIVKHWKGNPSVLGWSKMVILKPSNRFKLLGSWSVQTGDSCGCFFSNLSWEPYVHTSPWSGKNSAESSFYGRSYGYETGLGYEEEYVLPEKKPGVCKEAYAKKTAGPVFRLCPTCRGAGVSSESRATCPTCSGHRWVRHEEPAEAPKTPEVKTEQTGAASAPAYQPVRFITAPVRFITAEEGHQPESPAQKTLSAAKRMLTTRGVVPRIRVWNKSKGFHTLQLPEPKS